MLVKIKCPKCDTEGSFSLADPVYEGPYRCWKCRALFSIKMKAKELESIEPISEEEFNRQMEIQALRSRFRKQ
jgi:hypothetical protein